jgi:mono/diheme cytochrome c family protein
VVGRLSPTRIRALVARCPDLDLVVSSDDQGVTREQIDTETTFGTGDAPGFVGRTLVLYATYGSYAVGHARLVLDAERRIARARVGATWLGDSIPDDAATRARLTAFYRAVGATAAAQRSVPPLFASDAARMTGRYAGAAACASCHAPETAQWKETPHASAWKTLLDVHRNFQPRCVACHVVGFGTEQGFRMGDASNRLVNVQCETCHGPGGDHVAAPRRENIRRYVPQDVCLECHTPDHSDRFVYVDKLPRIEHRRTGTPR